ncbi:MAG: hypothetical protein FD180_2858 [Planctomycetota bacterium]|nr:MAG: hypothetical protein FD180_2858 [Planctomycetota bacterium]
MALFLRGEELFEGKLLLGIELRAAEAFLALFGAVFLAQGSAALLRGLTRGRGTHFRPQGPWRWEWPWNPEGVGDRLAVRARERLISVPIALAAMVPAGWILWSAGLHTDRRFAGLLFAPAAVELLLALYYAVLLKIRGRGRLQFHTCPFAAGGTLQARYFPTARMLGYGPRMRATLRCLEIVGRAQGGRVTVRELWRWTEDAEIVGGVVEIILEISAPPSLATRFRKPVRFWELEVGPWAPGAAGNATFVVPVYADPSLKIPERTPAPAAPVRRPVTDRPVAAARRPASAAPAHTPGRQAASNPPSAPLPAPAPPRRTPSSPPVAPTGVTPSGRLPEYPPVPVPRMEQPGASPTSNPTPVGFAVEKVGERFRCELLLTPALTVEELSDRVSKAFEVTLEPLPGAEEGTFFGLVQGLDVALQAGGESRRLVLGGTRPMDPGPGDASERAADWAIAKLMMAGVAARKPS